MEVGHRKETKVYWDVASLLGGKKVLGTTVKTEFDLIELSNEGLKRESLDALISFLCVAKKYFVEEVLDLSVKTIERKRPDDRLGRHTSSHIIEIAKVVEHAVAVFEDDDKVRDWLTTPNRSINSMRPLELFHMPTGLALVNTVLGRIEEGVYS
ncbi:type II RES/Xre toxin-antitoxin system antitoxin [Parapedobacter sp. 10938]|uniref:type II RES/Xre toxin-antitoxin system antitoxin n=1 Tax=Parapedobacter flavus TaxID=3110225 RepID=UPI002DBBB0CF|nr:antitoxin Xre/MbcA/ParS toxin-binding domain-containing protein [Parapedobacter sp. 10938]MEC3879815.1 antitoxin Xre/MbcA/ParS toxin-binding domain-containing protein [Parapedobacter sp. 10938]